ncbi:acyl-CoA carboxylase epsilon subunit [Streptomyces djakartensis]|uniref:acyl-CoA carboxylase epsilon subunit n=1 Tax=Streptomyces djakartensis TaxID=68193 RepID=UPI0034DFBBBF
MSHDGFLRIEKGQAEPEELAALTAVLLAHAAAGHTRRHQAPRTPPARWHRPHHPPYHSPHSWQAGT